MNPSLELVASVLFLVWLLVLTYFVGKTYLGILRVLKGAKKESIMAILDDILEKEDENKKKLIQIMASYDKLKTEGISHIQKIGLVRFNPFRETGGDQSFILALVDAEDTGVIISSFHTRTGTRWYAKSVVKGRGIEHDLSEDEKKALKGARFLSETK